MNHATDVWWSSAPTSLELSRSAADRSAAVQALRGERRPGRLSLRRRLDAALALVRRSRVRRLTLEGRPSAGPRAECGR